MEHIKLRNPIYSFTLKELYDNRDGGFIHHDQHTSELDSPNILYCYANTAVFEIKSSHFGETVKMEGGRTGTNKTMYKIFVLFEDFYTIGRDKDIEFEDAIDYAINFGDVHIRCTCPAHLYWGYAYEATQMKYLYGIPRENRFPKIRNPNLKGTICKHEDAVIQWIMRNKETIAQMFALYYDRLKEGQSIYAVNPKGTTITIGHKEQDGDIFFERQKEEEEEMEETMKMAEETLAMEDEPEEQENVEEGGIVDPDELWENPDEVEEF